MVNKLIFLGAYITAIFCAVLIVLMTVTYMYEEYIDGKTYSKAMALTTFILCVCIYIIKTIE